MIHITLINIGRQKNINIFKSKRRQKERYASQKCELRKKKFYKIKTCGESRANNIEIS